MTPSIKADATGLRAASCKCAFPNPFDVSDTLFLTVHSRNLFLHRTSIMF